MSSVARRRDKETRARLLQWEGPGAEPVRAALAEWEHVQRALAGLTPERKSALLRQVGVERDPDKVVASLRTVHENAGVPTESQRLDPLERALIEEGVGSTAVRQRVEAEAAYARGEGDWVAVWEERSQSLVQGDAVADARDAFQALQPYALHSDLRRLTDQIESAEQKVASTDQRVRAGQLSIHEGLESLNTVRDDLRENVKSIARTVARSVSPQTRQRMEEDSSMNSMFFYAVMASAWPSSPRSEASSSSSSSSSSYSFDSSGGGFDGGSGGF